MESAVPEAGADPVPIYAVRGLIPYIGSKRALLPELRKVFGALAPDAKATRLCDPFAGTGAVARLARWLGYRVAANDIEPYSAVVNACALTLTPSSLAAAFAASGGVEAAYARLNALHPNRENAAPSVPHEPYLARWYAPRDTERPDVGRERLFYTRENAVFLDRARQSIEDEYGGNPTARLALLSSLLVEAAVHTNTSGVFKAYHRGFGGHGRDSLSRILGDAVLEPPELVEAPPSLVGNEDAAAFCARSSWDLVYLDPPYNQHQYGSNYHLLNTIVRWDGRPEPLDLGTDGTLLRKAGIPETWKATRSDFCRAALARSAFERLVDAIDARHVVVSYNTEGIVPFPALAGLLASRGRLEIQAFDYVRYRGGRQSAERRIGNHELLLIVDTTLPGNPEAVERHEAELAARKALARTFDRDALGRSFAVDGDVFRIGSGRFALSGAKLVPEGTGDPLAGLDTDGLRAVSARLGEAATADNAGTVRSLASGLARSAREAARDAIRGARSDDRRRVEPDARAAVTYLRKLAYPKWEAAFREAARALGEAAPEGVTGAFVERSVRELAELLEKRRRGRAQSRSDSTERR